MTDATRSTLVTDPYDQWLLRRESIGLTATIAGVYTREYLADQRIEAARDARLARQAYDDDDDAARARAQRFRAEGDL